MLRRLATPMIALAASVSLAGCNLLPEGRASSAPTTRTTVVAAAGPKARQCLAELGGTGARFAPQPDKYYGAGCSTLNSVTVERLRGDADGFELANMGPVTCPAANALAGWARYGVDRAARQILGSRLQRIETMGSYACRNVAGSSRRSAHASADAIDIAGFVLEDGTRISVSDGWNGSAKEREFLRVVQRSACRRFDTVLGPEYNAAHRDHFHLEGVIDGSSYCR